jgi:uncharacterized protein
MLIFLDANILFSAANKNSNIHRLLLLASKQASLLVSPHVLEEAERNLAQKRPNWQGTFQELMDHISTVPDAMLREPVKLATHDHPVLGAAIAADCDYLVTGDKRDFGHLYNKTVGGVKIVDYLTLTDIILKRLH